MPPVATERDAAPLDALLLWAGQPRGLGLPDRSVAHFAAAVARRPRPTVRRLLDLTAELAKITVGSSSVTATRRDRRFSDQAWSTNPVLRRWMQAYLAAGSTLDALITDADLDSRDRHRVEFVLGNLRDALAPSNLPLVNPASAKTAIDTGGLSFARGAAALIKDLASAPRIPQMVDKTPFTVGVNVAATPGAVALRTPVLELIQYTPQTPQVATVPLLIVPPTINKYYAIDLAPGRSLVEHLVQQGIQVFVLSWRNPDASHADWGIDHYVAAVITALGAVERITGSERTSLMGSCSGGILSSCVAGHLAARGDQHRLACLALMVTVLDDRDAGAMAALTDPATLAAAKAHSRRRGYLDGSELAEVFAWLRPNDLIWNYWVNNYLLGKKPPAFDILFWNADAVRMSAQLHADFIDLSQDHGLAEAGGITVLGTPIDLAQVKVDNYVLAGVSDHITPWRNCYRNTSLLGGDSRFILSTSGHIAALVNPLDNPKSSYQTNADTPDDPERWLQGADTHKGSWWPDLVAWLKERGGAERAAPADLGGADLNPLEAAPGTYVHDT